MAGPGRGDPKGRAFRWLTAPQSTITHVPVTNGLTPAGLTGYVVPLSLGASCRHYCLLALYKVAEITEQRHCFRNSASLGLKSCKYLNEKDLLFY